MRVGWYLSLFDRETETLAEPEIRFRPPSDEAVTNLFGYPDDSRGEFPLTPVTVGQIEEWTGRSIDIVKFDAFVGQAQVEDDEPD